MKPDDLPILGIIRNWNSDYIHKFVDLTGKRVLCIGYAEDQIDRLIAPLNPASVEILTLWQDHIDALPGKYAITIGNICEKTPFPDGTFDAVLTQSLLEHLNPLEDAIIEMKRISRPYADHCHFFGPVWSSAYGSHLYASADDPLLSFSMWRLPAYMHLLSSPEEIREFYGKHGYSTPVIDLILNEIFGKDHLNRLFYDEYVKVISRHYFIQNVEAMTNDVPEEILGRLRANFPGSIDFATYGAKYHVRVPAA